jgi:glycosyltransferase involved in cell wall biosynthesis
MSNKILLSVIVRTYNRVELLALCLDSLIKQTAPKSAYEILVIDNNSTDILKTV